jgi:hypothetical protein
MIKRSISLSFVPPFITVEFPIPMNKIPGIYENIFAYFCVFSRYFLSQIVGTFWYQKYSKKSL